MTKYTNTGDHNTGNHNTGNHNTGNHNTGDRNTGNHNTGYWNTGYWNTGNWNTGYWNTGDRNTGYHNTGYWNTGNHNTGDRNTGSWNTACNHVGCFNTIDAKQAYYFNTLIDVEVWNAAEKPSWLFEPKPTTWVFASHMTDTEKEQHSEHETTGGYLRVNNMAEEWKKAYAKASPQDIQKVKNLPGFDADVFMEITGLDLRDKPTSEGREIEIDGVVYVLKAKKEQ